ncbi:MAG: acetate--CoA ligase family protein [Alphaproteobacteria bacterium]
MTRALDLARLFNPRGIAVLGASPDLNKIRGRILAALKNGGYAGRLVPVNPSHREVQGLPAVSAVRDLPGGIDLAIVAIPADQVAAALNDCAAAGIGGAVVLSSGFAETGGAGIALQREVERLARERGIALLGPNSVGFLNKAAGITATFSPGGLAAPTREIRHARRIAIASQSGGLGFALYNRGIARGLPFNLVVTTGNEAGVTCLDALDYALGLDDTGAVVMFVEGLRDGERLPGFSARAAEKRVPLIVAKIGRSEAAARAALSHTGSDTGDEAAYARLFDEAGVILGDDQDELLDLAAAFATSPLPEGPRVGIVTISGGAGAWLADRVAATGLSVPMLDDATQADIRAVIPPYGTAVNPVDITAHALEIGGRIRAIEALMRSPSVDAVAVAASLADVGHLRKEQGDLARIAAEGRKPLLFYTYTMPSPDNLAALDEAGIACYTTLDGMARGLAGLSAYAARRRSMRSDRR